jgi:prephenate dehydratase
VRVAYQGVPGAFAHQACLAFLPEATPTGCATFADVVTAVALGEAERGVLPVENSRAGPVADACAAIAAGQIAVLDRRPLTIRVHLLGLPGSDLALVRTAVSHPMALAQCADTLARLGLDQEAAVNTAVAAQSLADPTKAVLASEAAADAYGLVILMRDVQDSQDNATTFAIIGPHRP